MFQAIATRQRSLSRQLEYIQERNRWRRLKGQENLAHTLVLCHTVILRMC
ncbi:hypothetical protein J2807_002444 [Enterobacter ludwigii]|nr:hypothetical protein [Enterobacter ludwigii]